jgi:hypothetical protein
MNVPFARIALHCIELGVQFLVVIMIVMTASSAFTEVGRRSVELRLGFLLLLDGVGLTRLGLTLTEFETDEPEPEPCTRATYRHRHRI